MLISSVNFFSYSFYLKVAINWGGDRGFHNLLNLVMLNTNFGQDNTNSYRREAEKIKYFHTVYSAEQCTASDLKMRHKASLPPVV